MRIGNLATGIVLGPYVLNLIDSSILNISSELRKIALIIILTRAGLGLDITGLKKIGRPAILMCFLPASFELLGIILIAPKALGMSVLEAAIMGAVLAAVSPAVVVPRMVKLMDNGYGTAKGIPQLILAGASVDDVYVIVLFSTFTGMMQGKGASIINFVNIPVSIILEMGIGILAGYLLAMYFEKIHIRDTVKVLLILSISFILVATEDMLNTPIKFSALIAIMFVGATVNINYLGNMGIKALIVIFGALIFRMAGVFVCLIKTELNKKERLFTMMAYTPKATVQAAIGGIPLALNFACGETVLTIAVLAIVITAPLGAFAMDLSYKKLLRRNE